MRPVGKLFLKGSDTKSEVEGIHSSTGGGGFGKKTECLIDANPFKRPLSI